MRKWKVRTESGNVGKIQLSDMSVCVTEQNITVKIDITAMSVNIESELMRAVDLAKKPIIKKFAYLRITYGAENTISHYIIMEFMDTENNCLVAECKLGIVPLSPIRQFKEKIISKIYNHFI